MTSPRIPNRVVGAAWFLLCAALIGGIGFWSASLGGAIDHPKPVAAVPSPRPVRAIPTVVTEYAGAPFLTAAELCAKVAPSFNAVIVDNVTGYVVANIHC